METFGKLCTAIIIFILSAIIGGYVLLQLWTWFMVTIFHLQALTLAQAIATKFVINALLFKPIKKDMEDKEPFIPTVTKSFCIGIFWAIATLCIGWVIYQFI